MLFSRLTVVAPSANQNKEASSQSTTPTMASSSHSFSAREFNAAMLRISVGSPWSEAEPGAKFDDWWEQQFHSKEPRLEMGNSDQQLEWVIGMSSRVGTNGCMKPLTGLSEAARLQFNGRQPGGSTVKVVCGQCAPATAMCS